MCQSEVSSFESALRALAVPPTEVMRASPDAARQIQQEAMKAFVVNNPRAWWMALRHRQASVHFPQGDGHRHLQDYVPASQSRAWFIIETGQAALPVYDVEVASLARIISECQFFEYYLVDRDFEWLICDTDHNELVICRNVPATAGESGTDL